MTASKTKVVRAAYETMQFFEVDIPDGYTPEEYMKTGEFRTECMGLIDCEFIEFKLERKFNEDREEI